MSLFGAEDKEDLRSLGYFGGVSHSKNIGNAFKTLEDADHKYNMYQARKLKKVKDGKTHYLPLQLGDQLFHGRKPAEGTNTTNWDFDDFKSHAGESYSSHSDIITGAGYDEDLEKDYYEISGGNIGDTYKTEKIYFDKETNKILGKHTGDGKFSNKYKGAMTLGDRYRPQNMPSMDLRPLQPIDTETEDQEIAMQMIDVPQPLTKKKKGK